MLVLTAQIDIQFAQQMVSMFKYMLLTSYTFMNTCNFSDKSRPWSWREHGQISMGRNDFSVFTFCNCTPMGSKKWLCLSVIHFCIFPPPALLWKGRYNPSWCMHYPAARTKYQRFHRYSLRFSPFVWVPWVQSFSCPGLYVPLSGLPLERSLWPMLVYICRYRQNISCWPLQDLPFVRCLDWAQL